MADLQLIRQALGDLDGQRVLKLIEDFVTTKPSEAQALEVVDACQQGMGTVGDLFERGDYFVGDLIYAGELLTKVMDLLKPVIRGESASKVGTIVLGTVKGDIHDIGKNIFKNLAESVGFEVCDLGVDVPPGSFAEKVKEIKPDVVGMSGVLTLATQSMKETVDALKAAGLRESVKIIIGGNHVTSDVCQYAGADAYTTNAAAGVKICQGWVK